MNKSEDIQKINEYIASGYEVDQNQIKAFNDLGWTINWNKVGWSESDGRSILKPTFTKNINKDLEIYIHEWEEGWSVMMRQLYDLEDYKDSELKPPGEWVEELDNGESAILDDTPEIILSCGATLEWIDNLVDLLKKTNV